ncbi:acyloxyacyl hydrolase [Prosthecobacter sp.]|uniref:acyloxyacyl hydrolase n=1 Tax=Prosthecobacter sp. TaxID=1965333 RepID=UPI002AB9C2F6|nr:acyloxyacyl hydrolase [Prosthecobacter sp.]MDZ4403690.1 acyloxyacyl hydrolase [Prosthecobacter sp.]
MTRRLACLAIALLLSTTGFSQSAPSEFKPWTQHSFDFETGMLWKVGGDTTFNYRIVPFIVSWRTPEMFGLHFQNGSALSVRNKFSLMANWFETGSENRYLGLSGAPSIEWWDPTATWSVFGSIGGGVGWVDAQNVPGGQGQDFTLNWFGQLGVSRTITQDWSLRASAMFQHLSNGGQTNPNPGLDSLGILIGLSRDF